MESGSSSTTALQWSTTSSEVPLAGARSPLAQRVEAATTLVRHDSRS